MQRPSSLFLLPLVLVGCGSDAPPPDEVRARIANDLVVVANETEAATAEGQSFPNTASFGFLETAVSGQLGSLLDVGETDTSVPFLAQSKIARIANLLAPRIDLRSAKDQQLFAEEGEEDLFDGAETAKWLNDNIFTDANHAGDGIYKVPASLACT